MNRNFQSHTNSKCYIRPRSRPVAPSCLEEQLVKIVRRSFVVNGAQMLHTSLHSIRSYTDTVYKEVRDTLLRHGTVSMTPAPS